MVFSKSEKVSTHVIMRLIASWRAIRADVSDEPIEGNDSSPIEAPIDDPSNNESGSSRAGSKAELRVVLTTLPGLMYEFCVDDS